MAKITDLVADWRAMGLVAWAESAHGWIMEDLEPIELEPWQAAALDAWWAHRGTVTTLAISNIKKTGKTTLNATLLAWRWLCIPGEHFAAANDLDQSQGRQFAMISKMIDRHPILSRHTRKTQSLITFQPTGSTIEAIEVDATGRAGSNHWTASHTETWGIIHETGIRAYEELTPPPGQRYGFPALRICDSYAGWIDESTTWHELVDRGKAGDQVPSDWPIWKNGGLLLFHLEGEEAQRRCFRGTEAQRKAYYTDQVADLRAGTYSRLHLNQRTSGESKFVPIEAWEALVHPRCRPVHRPDDRAIWIGVDAGTKRDAAALVACTYNREKEWVELAHVREWKPKLFQHLTGGMDLDATIGDEVRKLRASVRKIEAVYYDPWQMTSLAQRLEKDGVNMAELPQTSSRTAADQSLYDAITAGTLRTFKSPKLTAAIRKAAGKETPRGFRLTKRSGDDLVVALSMAHLGASQARGSGGVRVYEWAGSPSRDKPDPNWPKSKKIEFGLKQVRRREQEHERQRLAAKGIYGIK